MEYTVQTRRLAADTYEFVTRNGAGETVSTVLMSQTKAIALGLVSR
ncbi:hypothetical protein OG879_31510 [Streptomyces caniferus]|nr:hypothetical protein [Streptomyces caniferus]